MTVFLTTHYMEEAEHSDYITVIGHGEILEKGTPLELKQRYCRDLLKLVPRNPEYFKQVLEEQRINFQQKGEIIEIKLDSTMGAFPLVERLKYYVTNVEIINGTMDDVFLDITGRENE